MNSRSFRDFDAFAATVRDVDCVMLLQNPDRHHWRIDQVNVNGVDVQVGKLGSGNIVEGRSWSDGYLLYLPLTDTTEYSANGRVVGYNALAILEPGCDFCISTRIKHDWCSIFVPTNRFMRGGDLPEPSFAPAAPEMTRCRVTRRDRRVAQRLGSVVTQIMTASASSPRFESSPAANSAAEQLMKIATSVLGEGQADKASQEGRSRVPRPGIIRSSKELLEKRAGQHISVAELAVAAEVSERTLRTAFNDYYGVGPVRYLQLRQLHLVHRALRTEDPRTTSVSDVLVDHCVWEFGRFASRYRRLFGELPSQTLRVAR